MADKFKIPLQAMMDPTFWFGQAVELLGLEEPAPDDGQVWVFYSRLPEMGETVYEYFQGATERMSLSGSDGDMTALYSIRPTLPPVWLEKMPFLGS
jgi:hypothetical protein